MRGQYITIIYNQQQKTDFISEARIYKIALTEYKNYVDSTSNLKKKKKTAENKRFRKINNTFNVQIHLFIEI